MGKAGFGLLVRVFVFWTVALSLGNSIIYLYLQGGGLDTLQMLIYGFAYFAAPTLLMLFGGWGGTGALRWGILSQMAALVALASLGGLAGALAFAIIGSAIFPFFWVPFNTLWFGSRKAGNAMQGALFFSVLALAGILGPGVAGLVAEGWGFPALFAVAALVLVPGVLIVWKGESASGIGGAVKAPAEGVREIAGFRTLTFMEGFGGVGLLVLIPIITLEYFDEPVGLGAFFSAAALASIILSLIFARISDERMRRRGFLLFTSAGFGAGMVLCSAAGGALVWFAGVVMVMFFKNVFSPFSMAILVDKCRDLHSAMYGREFVLEVGRALGGLLAIGIYLASGDLRLPLFLCGLSLFAYGAVFEFFKKKALRIA